MTLKPFKGFKGFKRLQKALRYGSEEQLFLFPRVTKMKAKVVPARFPTEAASSSVAATEAEATASEAPGW